MRESEIEKWLVRQVRNLGGICDKFVSTNNPGVPDRIVIMPGGRILFVELKTENGYLRSIQKYQHERYEKVGADVRVVRGLAEAQALVEELRGALGDGTQTQV